MLMANSKNANTKSKLEALQLVFYEQLPERMIAIEHLWQACCGESFDKRDISELHRLSHSLAGLAGSFGAAEISKSAHELDVVLGSIIDSEEQSISDEQKQYIDELTVMLKLVVKQWKPADFFV